MRVVWFVVTCVGLDFVVLLVCILAFGLFWVDLDFVCCGFALALGGLSVCWVFRGFLVLCGLGH